MRATSDPGSGTVDRPVITQRPTRASPTIAVVRALGRRVLVAVATVVAVSMLVFAAIEIVPIDPALHALGRESTPEQRALFRQRMHLDDPPVRATSAGAATSFAGTSAPLSLRAGQSPRSSRSACGIRPFWG